jgi:hypothetical protein
MTCLIVVVFRGVHYNNVVFVQWFTGSFEAIGYLVRNRQSAGPWLEKSQQRAEKD